MLEQVERDTPLSILFLCSVPLGWILEPLGYGLLWIYRTHCSGQHLHSSDVRILFIDSYSRKVDVPHIKKEILLHHPKFFF
jgi:hypothetical protein